MPVTMRRRLLDVGVPAALVVGGVLDLWVVGADFEGARGINAAFLVAACAPLAWRRRQPLTSLVASVAVVQVYVLLLYRDVQPPFVPFLVGLVACFAVGLHGSDRDLRFGAAFLAFALICGGIPQIAAGQNVGNVVPVALYWSGAMAAGRFMRGRQRIIAMLGDRAADLEREREQQAAHATLEERARIARELHDVIAHSVSVMVVQASAERRVLAAEHISTHEALEAIERAGRESLAELRRLLGVLRAPGRAESLAPQPGLEALDVLVDDSCAAGQEVTIHVDGEPLALTAGVDLAAYRVVQEALTNARKHAPGARAVVTLRWRRSELGIEVVDDGPGPASERNGTGHGLVGMRERVALYGGRFEAGRADTSGGFRISARLPVDGGDG